MELNCSIYIHISGVETGPMKFRESPFRDAILRRCRNRLTFTSAPVPFPEIRGCVDQTVSPNADGILCMQFPRSRR